MPFEADHWKGELFVENGQEPPGSIQDGKWVGQNTWLTRHGTVVVWWQSGRPRRAFDVLFGGARIDIENIGVKGWRRPDVGDRDWTYGTAAISATNVMFTDSPNQPVNEPLVASEQPSLEYDLMQDAVIKQAVQERSFAESLYTALWCAEDFVRIEDAQEWNFSEERAAHLVASLRNRGEYYLDYFPHATGVAAAALPEISRLGWRPKTFEEYVCNRKALLERRVELLFRVRRLELLEPSSRPDWMNTITLHRMNSADLRGISDLSSNEREAASAELAVRLFRLAETGRASKGDFDLMEGLLLGRRCGT